MMRKGIAKLASRSNGGSMARQRRIRSFGAGLLLVLVAAVAVLGGEASTRAAGNESDARLGLWRFVEAEHFAILGEGKVRQQYWGIYVSRGAGPNGASEPCIQEVTFDEFGGYSTGSECGALAPPGKWPVYTLSRSSVGMPNGRRVESSIIGMTLAADVTRVKLDLNPGKDISLRTRLLNPAQARKARVEQFRYLAFGLARSACIAAVSGFGLDGETLFKTTRYSCR